MVWPFLDGFQSTLPHHQSGKRGRPRGGNLETSPTGEERGWEWDPLVTMELLE